MDTFTNKDFSLSKGGGAQFGEYPATKKVNAAQSNSSKSNNVTQEVNTEFGEYQKTTNEIGMDSDNKNLGGDILQATSSGVTLGNFGATTTKITDLNTQYGASFDAFNANTSDKFNLGDFQTSDYTTNNLEELGVDVLQQTSSAETFLDSNTLTKNTPNTNMDSAQNFDFSAYQGNEVDNTAGFDFNEYQVTQKDPDPNQILHQSIEPGFETNPTTETGSIQTNNQFNDINAKTENYQDFDLEAYLKTEITGDNESNLKNTQNLDNQTNGPILDKIPDFDTNEFRINELVDTTYQTNETAINKDSKGFAANEFIDTASYQPSQQKIETKVQKVDTIAYNPSEPIINYENLDIKDFSGDEYIDTAYQVSQPIINRPSTIQKIDTIALNPSQTVVKSGSNVQKIDTAEYKKSEPIIDSAVFQTQKYDTISGFDATNYGTTTTTKTTKTTTTTTTKKSSPAIDFTTYPTTKTTNKTSSDLQIIDTNDFQEFKPVVETNSTIDTTALTTSSPDFDIDALLANYEDTNTYQTSNQEFINTPLVDTTSYSLPTQTTIVKQKPLPVQKQTTTTIINQTPLPAQTTSAITKAAPLPTKTTVIKTSPLPVQTQKKVIKSKPLTTQTTVIKSPPLPTTVIKPTPLPVQTTTTIIKQTPLPVQTTKTVVKSPPLSTQTQTIINTNSLPKETSPIVDTGFTLENIESSPDFNIDEILKNYETIPNQQQGRDSTILDEFFSSPQSFTSNIPQPSSIPSFTTQINQVKAPSIPITIPEPIVPTTLKTGATFGEYKQSSNIEEIQTAFSPSFDLFNLNQGLPETETIPLNLPETIPPNLPETIPPNIKTIITAVPKVQQQVINIPSQNNIQVPQNITYEQKSYVPPPQLVEIPKRTSFSVPKVIEYEQKSFVPSPQSIGIPTTTTVISPQTVQYSKRSYVPPPQLVEVTKRTSFSVPKTIQYTQSSFVPPPQVLGTQITSPISVPKTIPYAQKSFVPPPNKIGRAHV